MVEFDRFLLDALKRTLKGWTFEQTFEFQAAIHCAFGSEFASLNAEMAVSSSWFQECSPSNISGNSIGARNKRFDCGWPDELRLLANDASLCHSDFQNAFADKMDPLIAVTNFCLSF